MKKERHQKPNMLIKESIKYITIDNGMYISYITPLDAYIAIAACTSRSINAFIKVVGENKLNEFLTELNK